MIRKQPHAQNESHKHKSLSLSLSLTRTSSHQDFPYLVVQGVKGRRFSTVELLRKRQVSLWQRVTDNCTSSSAWCRKRERGGEGDKIISKSSSSEWRERGRERDTEREGKEGYTAFWYWVLWRLFLFFISFISWPAERTLNPHWRLTHWFLLHQNSRNRRFLRFLVGFLIWVSFCVLRSDSYNIDHSLSLGLPFSSLLSSQFPLPSFLCY